MLLSAPSAHKTASIVPLAPERYRIQFTASAATRDKLLRAQELLRHRIPSGDLAQVFDRALDVLVRDLEKERFGAADRPRAAKKRTRCQPVSSPRSSDPAWQAGDRAAGGDRARGDGDGDRAAGRERARRDDGDRAPGGDSDRHEAARGDSALTRASRHVPAAVKRVVSKRDQGRCAFVSPSGVRCTERGWIEFDHIRPHGDGGRATVDNVRLLCRSHNQHEARRFFGVWESDVGGGRELAVSCNSSRDELQGGGTGCGG